MRRIILTQDCANDSKEFAADLRCDRFILVLRTAHDFQIAQLIVALSRVMLS